jgi:DNA replication protein DnaC
VSFFTFFLPLPFTIFYQVSFFTFLPLRATLIASQLPVEHWHDTIGEATVADAILDRLLHNAHRIALSGDSMRKTSEPPAQPTA